MQLPDFLAQDEYGYIKLAGHRIGLHHVVRLYNDGCPPELIREEYPTLALALIYKVIGFYLDNPADVDAYVAQHDAEMQRLMAAAPRGPDTAELRRRMEALRQARGA